MSRDFTELGVPADFSALASASTITSLRTANAVLNDRSVVFVDDQRDYLAAYVLPLQFATSGKARFVQAKAKTCGELAAHLLKFSADIILVDYFLTGAQTSGSDLNSRTAKVEFNGADLIEEIRGQQDASAPPIVIGFSADGMFEEFARAGANGATTKFDPVEKALLSTLGFNPPALAVLNISQIVNDLSNRGTSPAKTFSTINIEELGRSLDWFKQNALFLRGQPPS